MGAFSSMHEVRRYPGRRLGTRPHGILPITTTIAPSWRPAPTGFYPDAYGDHMGHARNDYLVMSPDREVPMEPGSNSELIDQHAYLQVDATWTPDAPSARPTGRHDPLTDGPPPPTPRIAQLFLHPRSGTSRTRFMDVPDGRKFSPVGTQDGTTTIWYQSAGAALAPLGADGSIPETRQQIGPGPTRGWSAVPAVNAQAAELKKAAALTQMQRRGQNRRATSTFAGQTFSQRTAYVANPPGAGGATPSWRGRG